MPNFAEFSAMSMLAHFLFPHGYTLTNTVGPVVLRCEIIETNVMNSPQFMN